jgi:anti-sigma factor RsiW
MKLFRRDLACAELVELVTDYLEGGLSTRDRKRLEAHLAGCDHCDAYLAQMRLTISVTGRLRAEDLPPALQEQLLVAFRSWRTAS